MMHPGGTLTITTPSDREIVMTRAFDAPRQVVFDAYTKPEFVRQWLLGPPGWTMPVCEIDLRVGGGFRYLWQKAGGIAMGMRGVYLEIVVPERIVATEVFDQAWYSGEAVGTVTFVEHHGRTTLSIRMRYDSQATRDGVLKSPMEEGVGAGFDRLAGLLAQADGGPG